METLDKERTAMMNRAEPSKTPAARVGRGGKALGLAIAASLAALALSPAGAMAYGPYGRQGNSNVTGEVVVTKQVPGGTVTVGVGLGQPRPVVVEERKVVVVEKQECPREVTVIREREPVRKVVVVREPARKVTIIRKEPVRQVTVVKQYDDGKWYPGKYEGRQDRHGNRHGRGNGYGHGRGRRDDDGSYHRYEDGNTKYVARADQNGSYRYYEDEHGVSIQEVTHQGTRDEYYRK